MENLLLFSYLTKMAWQPHLRSAFPHAYQGYACVSCVPGSPRYPHPLTRLCVWRLPPARLLVDPGVPGSTFHTCRHSEKSGAAARGGACAMDGFYIARKSQKKAKRLLQPFRRGSQVHQDALFWDEMVLLRHIGAALGFI